MYRTGAIILAAGKSLRMGRPKQLIPWKGGPLVRLPVAAARNGGADPIWMVTGAHADQVGDAVGSEGIRLVHNDRFAEGMGSSIAAGFRAAIQTSAVEAVFLLLCDQPAVDAALLRHMDSRARESGRGLIACRYRGTMGPPIRVVRSFFHAFTAIPPGTGARRILHQHPDDLETVDFPEGGRDLDTPADLGNHRKA
jgi:molybdenum cofactor cytidylyltransferase